MKLLYNKKIYSYKEEDTLANYFIILPKVNKNDLTIPN